ncbi:MULTISPECIES: choline ABC transporter ATP-binding protein [Thalassospira]|jgi:glycine betaine/proline transport system ATP-binding protein|uniref:Choline ABC transporter ATP-binding protein n=1 Tax=Thalassospira xiamenensis TaxID=220697 RepID=A0ABR5Y365_9PROT|nr:MULTISPECIES: choline ABC transporter ATP-binding protein [Thalassospira]MBL4843866.1 choline ABC transporter ATP-binding protein [Thalassospira sp.]MBR9781702.1 choline ABC transporter ATP-binding protein [Rhodospirillales bacterium]KZD04962.1 choline ABC transporter ATP-binding protein [Thalassospira xiamenensis]KZD11654.1 choline ABC transporter ATP-binding protein [Thalassospira xiamenensis]MBR9815925.1 choline ABC transporter ATP-binding protein [Rhodospirillales bacterium]|tara:strand:+ start:441 stop:1637 length:1197 start_codon:yes stop_codon:yes gene_type:complete
MSNAVEFDNIDVIFGDKQAESLALLDAGKNRDEIAKETGNILGVANVSFDVPQGEICVLMGLSGSGKSSLLRCVNGLNRVSRGSLRVHDGDWMVDVTSCDANTLRDLRRKCVAMVFQQFGLFPWRTVEDNVGFGLELDGMGLKERREIVREKLALVGLDQWAGKYAHELSGGMQQRVGLARAFATDAPILLMDEPFSALDPLIRNRLQDELLDLQEKLNKTILFVSHDLDEAMKLGNSIAIMEGGYVVQHGTPEDIALRPANEYVADFVAHMNPVNILRGRAIMHRIDRDQRNTTGELSVEDEDIRITLQDGIIRAANSGEHGELKLIQYDGNLPDDLDGTDNSVIFVADDTVLLKDLIEMRSITQNPVLLTREGRISGTLGRKEFFESLTQTATVAD